MQVEGEVKCLHLMETGERVRNTYTICLQLRDSPEKLGLIPHRIIDRHLEIIKDLLVEDECAAH